MATTNKDREGHDTELGYDRAELKTKRLTYGAYLRQTKGKNIDTGERVMHMFTPTSEMETYIISTEYVEDLTEWR